MINVEFKDEINDLSTENLYQWDNYQTLNITGINFSGITPKVHFANKKSTEALVVQGVLKDDGSVDVSIPNSLLMEKYDIIGYVYINTGITSKTIKSITIPIIPRLKPTEYIQLTDENIAEIEAIELQAKIILEGLTASEYNPSVSYKRPNIVYHNLSSYMCISNDEITGIEPTDTSKWQKLANGVNITGISVNESGNLVFVNQDGSTYEIAFSTSDVKAVDEMEVPCLRLTSDNINYIKSLNENLKPQTFVSDGFRLAVLSNSITNSEFNKSYLLLITNNSTQNAHFQINHFRFKTSPAIPETIDEIVLDVEIPIGVHLFSISSKNNSDNTTTITYNIDGVINTYNINWSNALTITYDLYIKRVDNETNVDFIVLGV